MRANRTVEGGPGVEDGYAVRLWPAGGSEFFAGVVAVALQIAGEKRAYYLGCAPSPAKIDISPIRLLSMDIETSGFDDLIDEIEELERTVNSIDGEQVPFDELFPRPFMQRYTDADDIDTFLDRSPWKVRTQEDFEEIPETKFDGYVDDHSRFRTWEQMKSKAGNEWLSNRIDL